MLTNLACTMSDWETIGPLLHGTARAWRQKLDERLKPMGLSQAKWRTLLHLSLAPEPLTQTEIAARLGVEEHTSELQSHSDLVCRLLLGKKKKECAAT